MSSKSNPPTELVASGLGWPEGPAVLPDGRDVFVESYCSRLTVVGADRRPADGIDLVARDHIENQLGDERCPFGGPLQRKAHG